MSIDRYTVHEHYVGINEEGIVSCLWKRQTGESCAGQRTASDWRWRCWFNYQSLATRHPNGRDQLTIQRYGDLPVNSISFIDDISEEIHLAASTNRPIPKLNQSATKAEEVYPLYDTVSQAELESIDVDSLLDGTLHSIPTEARTAYTKSVWHRSAGRLDQQQL